MTNIIYIFRSLDFPSFAVLGLSIIIILGGARGIFSKQYRERIQERLAEELPERKKDFGSQEAMTSNKRSALVLLATGVTLLLVWLFFLRFFI